MNNTTFTIYGYGKFENGNHTFSSDYTLDQLQQMKSDLGDIVSISDGHIPDEECNWVVDKKLFDTVEEVRDNFWSQI